MTLSICASQENSQSDIIWNTISQKYYHTYKETRSLNKDILNGGKLISNRAVNIYNIPNDLTTKEGLESFLQTTMKGGLMDTIQPTEELYIEFQGSNYPIQGTAVIEENNIKYLQLAEHPAQTLNLDDELRENLTQSSLNLEKTQPYYVSFTGLMSAIVFDDGNSQVIKPQTLSLFSVNLFDVNEVYTVEELLEIIQNNKNYLTSFEDINNNLDPVTPNPYTM